MDTKSLSPTGWINRFNLESEEAVVGICISNPDDFPLAQRQLNPEDFFLPHTRGIYRILLELDEKQVAIDLMSVSAAATAAGLLVSDVARISGLWASFSSIQYHIDIVKRYSESRSVYSHAMRWAGAVAGNPLGDNLGAYVSDVVALEKREEETDDQAIAEHMRWLERGGNTPVLTTGITAIDNMIRCEADYLWVIGARPKGGKTSLVIDLFTRFAGSGQGRGLFFSLEMAKSRLMRKLNARCCPHAEFVRRHEEHEGLLTTYDLMAGVVDKCLALPIRIVDKPVTIEDIVSIARKMKRECPDLAYIGIDYAELVRTRRPMYPLEQLNTVLLELVALKKELRVPIFLISQIRRSGDKENPEPDMDELKGSGMLEQSADAMLLLWQGEMTSAEFNVFGSTYRKINCKVIQRDGPAGTVKLRYYPPQSLFGDWL